MVAVVVDDFGFGSSFFLGFVFVFCFCFFFFFFLRCVVVDKGERWLWPVVVVVGLVDAEVFVVFLWEV